MKKMMMVLMTLMMAGSLFAYEPRKECAKVKRNGKVVYYEKTAPYKPLPWDKHYKNCIKWSIRKGHTVDTYQCGDMYSILERPRKGHTVDQFVDYTYRLLECYRKIYYSNVEKATNPEPSDFDITMTELLNEWDGTDISPEEYAKSRWLENAKDEITWAVTRLAFVTEENFLALTKEEMLVKMNAFIEEVRAGNK